MSERDTERTSVKTYVPAYQKDIWREHADRLDMSQSEFVRTMVQVGRRDFDVPESGGVTPDDDPEPSGGEGLESDVIALLRSEGQLSWDELLARLTDDIEDRLDETLQSLQTDGVVRYSGRTGGYTVVADE
jgi:hypothetical protein